METETVVVERCRHNLNGDPTVIEYLTVTRDEAERLTSERCPNGFFWRRMPPDKTGAL